MRLITITCAAAAVATAPAYAIEVGRDRAGPFHRGMTIADAKRVGRIFCEDGPGTCSNNPVNDLRFIVRWRTSHVYLFHDRGIVSRIYIQGGTDFSALGLSSGSEARMLANYGPVRMTFDEGNVTANVRVGKCLIQYELTPAPVFDTAEDVEIWSARRLRSLPQTMRIRGFSTLVCETKA